MTSRKRVEAAFGFEEVDRVPLFDVLQNQELLRHCSGMNITQENAFDILCQTVATHLDATRSLLAPLAPGKWTDAEGFVWEVEWWTSWIIERPFRDVDETRAFIRRSIDLIHSLGVHDLYSFGGPVRMAGDDPQAAYWEVQDTLKGTVLFHPESGVGLDIAFHRLNLDMFSYVYAEDPILMSQWLEAISKKEVARVQAVQDAYQKSPIALVYCDIADKNSTLFSPTFLRKEFTHRLERLVAAWHAHGVKVVFHSDGNLWGILDDLIAAGIDAINPLEPLSHMDAVAVREKYPNLVLVGGIDASQLLPFGTPDDVHKEVERILKATEGRGIMLGSSTEIHPACAVDNVLTMWETARSFNMK